MAKISAGLIMYKFENKNLKVFLVHAGGPFWKNKNIWGIPKGEQENASQDLFEVAKREFFEETGIKIPENKEFIFLESIKQKNGKRVYAWAFENNCNPKTDCKSFVEMDYKGKKIRFPEIDDGKFFDIEQTKKIIIPAQFELIERLIKRLNIEEKKEKQTSLI